ncbi:class I SAM-dependent methyltransferase [Actinoalloteichus sp. AHMU CJ021]|uniref:Methyltransferase domain-containing protein n=1 Tax=Actinoalloteichus caeruleus DSM 43889 TaxID=1120930 RepID=A0ABT1JEL0_ACTCY|nr:class I SAM-dependent methyltransferase [Actinoalloteichus caeruleus]AUS77037.1 class I SAM-dependent methyltransferase [Actinoalloteichus sp. AHMU CJ021]MCP2330843.1 Methyltransferase domain-containing protein [Actinoalloteichus caeruleus DSM 43889]
MTELRRTGLVTYLLSNRAFVAPAVERAVETLGLSGRRRLLDAGTGAGGGLVALARAAGPDSEVLGVDLNPDVLSLARTHAEEEGVADRVRLRAGDLLATLDEATGSGVAFDAIWGSDVVWPGNFEDPAAVVAAMAGALAPDGVLGLFTSNYYQSMFLPGHARLQRALRTASELNWGLPGGGERHYDRHVHWMVAAGLRDIRVQVFPRVAFPVDDDPTARPYLERVVWPELLEAARSRGAEAGLGDEDIRLLGTLLTPGGQGYVLDDPGYYLVHPTLLVTGRR